MAESPLSRRLRVGIVHYRDSAIAGGSLRVTEAFFPFLDPARVEARVLFVYGGPGPLTQRVGVTSCDFLRARGPLDLRGLYRGRLWLRDFRPHVLHFVDPSVALQVVLADASTRHLLHIHGVPHPARMTRRDRILWSILGPRADGQITISIAARRHQLALNWGRADRVWIVRNAIDCQWFTVLPTREQARRNLGLPTDVSLVGMNCRLVKNRGVQDAIRVLTLLPRNWHLLVAGDGPFRPDLEDVIRERNMQGRVHLIGLLDDVRPALAAMDCFLLAARYDSFGLATCEAMAAGVPVFGLGGAGEYREPEFPLVTPDNSVFVERANPDDYDAPEPSAVLEQLAERLQHWGANRDAYSEMVRHAREWVRERFHADRQARDMVAVYEAVTTLERGLNR